MSEQSKFETRRELLKKAAGLSAAAAVAVVGAAGTAHAGGMSKASVQYQSTPKDGHQCDGCALWVPGPTPKAMGTCKAVAGPIDPTGWCTLWAPKG